MEGNLNLHLQVTVPLKIIEKIRVCGNDSVPFSISVYTIYTECESNEIILKCMNQPGFVIYF